MKAKHEVNLDRTEWAWSGGYASLLWKTESTKVKVQVGFLYSAAYAMTGPAARFTISEVAVDWQ